MTEETIFLTAVEQKTPSERAAYLESACAGNPALRERVEALLRSHEDPDSFLDVPAFQRQAADTDDPHHTTGLPPAKEKDSPGVEPDPGDGAMSFLAPAHEPGSLGRLDHYEVLELVGRGGMGVVFKARDTQLQRIVAIKVLAPQLVVNGTARKRFVREAQAAAAVRDDHVVSIHAVSEESAVTYLVMEFIAGITLAERVKQGGPLEVKEVLRIGLQAAKGLEAAHAQGLIHRDVTPGNILLENGVQRVKLTDFGLARAGNDTSLTQSGVIAGTPLYMSPEQARGDPLDRRSDLFSLGSVLYTLCTGRPAFPAGNSMAVLKKVCDDVPGPIREVNPDIPDWLAAIVNKLMAKDPAERFQSAGELAGLLEQHLATLQHPLAMGKRVATTAVPPTPPDGATRKRNRFTLVAVLLVLAATLGRVTVLAWPRLFPPSIEGSKDATGMANKKTPPAPGAPGVLTVSQKPDAGGRFRTINEALERVDPGMTIRVLDDGVYEEHLLINRPVQYRGVVLDAVGKATIRKLPQMTEIVRILGVSGFTLRGLHLESSAGSYSQVNITGHCPGVVLDRLHMTGDNGNASVGIWDVSLAENDPPIVIQNCTMRNVFNGLHMLGHVRGNNDRPLRCGHVIFRDNILIRCYVGVILNGGIYRTQVVGNTILDSHVSALDLKDLLPGAADVLIANNTLMGNHIALRLWDDSTKGKEFLKCKNIHFQNNLLLEPGLQADLVFLDHRRGNVDEVNPADVPALLKNPEWGFSHNWREIVPLPPDSRHYNNWIPAAQTDRLQVPIKVLSRTRGDPDFLRPPKDSPLAMAGAGSPVHAAMNLVSFVGQRSSPSNSLLAAWLTADMMSQTEQWLPSYVGAVPPEGVEPWDWVKTWKALAR